MIVDEDALKEVRDLIAALTQEMRIGFARLEPEQVRFREQFTDHEARIRTLEMGVNKLESSTGESLTWPKLAAAIGSISLILIAALEYIK